MSVNNDIDYTSPTVFVRSVSRTYRSHGRRGTAVHAIKNVSLVTYAGQSVGLLGHNGSGKSTLLRMIAGGDALTSGEILVSSQPSLLGVSAALQPQLTGADNVRLGCLAIGMSPEQTDEVFGDILDFADLGDAINRPMNTYSSGMGARLRFAIATAIEPEILLIDEALSTGDATFARKAKDRMGELLARSGTVFIVAHGGGVIRENCNHAIWLHEGEIIGDGELESVAQPYDIWGERKAARKTEEADRIIEQMKNRYTPPKLILSTEVKK